MEFLKKELVLDIKIKKALDQRECEELEMALQHTSKLCVYRQLKWEIGFFSLGEIKLGTPGIIKPNTSLYQEVRYYLLSRNWVGLKWHPVLKIWEQLQDKHSKGMQNSYGLKPLAILM